MDDFFGRLARRLAGGPAEVRPVPPPPFVRDDVPEPARLPLQPPPPPPVRYAYGPRP